MNQPKQLNYLLIDPGHQKDFSGVLPECLVTCGNTCAIGVYDDEGYILGAIAYRCEHFHYYVEWIFVDPAVRRQGIGSSLLRRLFTIIGGTMERYPVTCQVPFSEEEPEMYDFLLTQQCADLCFSHDRYHLKPQDIQNSKVLRRERSLTLEQTLFFDLSEQEQRKILQGLDREGVFNTAGMQDWSKGYIPSLCRVIYVQNTLMNLIFVKELPDRNLKLAFLYSKYPRGLAELVYAAVQEMEAHYPNKTLLFDAVTPESRQLAAHLFPNAKPEHIYEGEW